MMPETSMTKMMKMMMMRRRMIMVVVAVAGYWLIFITATCLSKLDTAALVKIKTQCPQNHSALSKPVPTS